VEIKKTANSPDVEPIYTFRGHTGPIYSVILSAEKETIFSAGVDSTIRVWSIPSFADDPYGVHGSAISKKLNVYEGHKDGIWDLSLHPFYNLLFSASADGTVKTWSIDKATPLAQTIVFKGENGDQHIPSSIDIVRSDVKKVVAGYTSATMALFDIETGKCIFSIRTSDFKDAGDERPPGSIPDIMKQINKIITHPTLPLVITAHEDRYMRFFDIKSGRCIQSMIAHLDAVTCLDIDPTGLYIVSGGHDSSLRFWDVGTKTCVQEFNAHRKKYDESVYCVAYHPAKGFIASGGADSSIKIYQ